FYGLTALSPPRPSPSLSLPDALPICPFSAGAAISRGTSIVNPCPGGASPGSSIANRCPGTPSRGSSIANRCPGTPSLGPSTVNRSEEHTSELQSRFEIVCRLLLEQH